jgi:hypothetical protein
MNEPERLDELASAHLDGISTSDDPAVLARVAEFERARAAVRSTPPVDDAQRDRMITAAMDAAVVIPIRPRRNLIATSAGIVAAAAVVVAVAFGLRGTSSGTKTASEAIGATSTAGAAATTAAPAADSTKQFGPESSAAAATAAGGFSASTTAASASTLASPAPTPPFVINSAADLPAIYRKSLAIVPAAGIPAGTCAINGKYVTSITYANTPAELWVTGTDPNLTLVAVAIGTCQGLAEVPLP